MRTFRRADVVPLPEHPRPTLQRPGGVYAILNGLWQWEPAAGDETGPAGALPFGRTLNRTILVPFPPESCLSGVRESHRAMWYRLELPPATAAAFAAAPARLRFGAVDWRCWVWFRGRLLGHHTGGYDGFSFAADVAAGEGNELLVFAYDPTELGAQPMGKQRAASIAAPGTDGERYTPSSGIWQTVWLERVPPVSIAALDVDVNLTHATVSARFDGVPAGAARLRVEAAADGHTVAAATVGATAAAVLAIPEPRHWSPASPFLYNLSVTLLSGTGRPDDAVDSYFGLRTVGLGAAGGRAALLLNGRPFFASGWLDQSFWPDGQYTAPTDEALAFDVAAVKTFGMNAVRLHQKINPERWYYHADKLGVVVMQDMVQKYG